MRSATSREAVDIGVTYWSREVGPYIWHEYDAARVASELRAIKSAGHGVVRTHLLWDAFMPTPERVEPARLRDFEHLLGVASDLALQVIPVLFLQTLGGCVMLPAYAIDVDARRPGLRAISGAVQQPGGPRYLYTDPLMLETCVRWIDDMLGAFAGHHAIATWDLGHDPAGGMRPHRIEHVGSWVALLSERIHEREERCMLTLSADDVVIARAVRPALVAGLVDAVGIDLSRRALEQAGGISDPSSAAFLAQVAQSLAGDAPLIAHLGTHRAVDGGSGHSDAETTDDADASARRFGAAAVDALINLGCAGVFASMWSNPGPRAVAVPPFDNDMDLRALGVVDTAGSPTAFGSAWLEQTRREHERSERAPWPATLDVDDYYANLPESLHELRAAWERGSTEHPAMLR
ncbi:MAG: hypothetical protein WCB51_06015 [Candidatus Dormiibacterota bacterium]